MLRFIMAISFLLGGISLTAQGIITGRIIDENGEALPGASVFIEEIRMGAIADETGLYLLSEVPPGKYTLRFSFVGYEPVKRITTIIKDIQKTLMHVQLTERLAPLRAAIVYATRLGEDAPFSFTNLDKEAIQSENLGQDVPYLLQRTPSAVVTSDAGTGIGYTGIRIRGTDPTRINVTINGIPLNDGESQIVYWVDLPDFASSTEDIQIQRGVGTSTNGGAAFGGSINLSTTQTNSDPYAEIDLSGGSFNTRRGALKFGSGILGNGFSLDGRLSRTDSDGYVDRASANLSSWYLAGAWMGENQWLRLISFSGKERTYQSWFGIDSTTMANPETRTFNPAGTEKPGEPYEDQVDDYQQTHIQLLHGWTINRNLNFSTALHYTHGFGYYEEYKAEQSQADYGLAPIDSSLNTDLVRRRWLDNHFYGGIFSLNYTSNSNRYRGILGGGWNQYLGDHFGEVIWAANFGEGVPEQRYYDNTGNKQDFNFYLKQSQKIGEYFDAFLDLQFRLVNYDFKGLDQNGVLIDQTVTQPFFNPKAGLSWTIKDTGLAYASFAVAHREPNRDDFVESSPKSRPTPERLYDVEVGYRKTWEKARLETNLYYMIYKDQLVLTGELNDIGAYTRVNVPESYRRGIEISGGLRPVSWFEIGGNLTLSQNKLENFTEFLDAYDEDFNFLGQDSIAFESAELSFSPTVIGALDFNFYIKGIEIGLLNKYVGSQFLDNSGSTASRLDSYFVSDLRIAHEWNPAKGPKSIALTLLVRNITNQLYASNGWSYRYTYEGALAQDRGYYPQAGINFMAGVRVGF